MYTAVAADLTKDVPEDALASVGRVLIAHDWLVTWGGSERVSAELLSMFPEAEVVTSVVSPSIRDLNGFTRRARESWMARLPGARKHHRWFLPAEYAAFRTLDTEAYDLVISSSHAFSKAVRARRPSGVHVCYCHSPPRYLWDLNDTYKSQASGAQRLALSAATGIFRRIDLSAARGVDHFVCNSAYVADRVQRWYGRPADVVHPPVATKPLIGKVGARGDFLLHLGRLVPYKRIDIAIQAAKRAGVRLVVAGDGPEMARLRALAGSETEFVGAVDESTAGELLSTCAAFIFCADEDFGIAPVEANAHGAPVIGLARGGLLETMLPEQTAELFPDLTVEGAASAIRRAMTREWHTETLVANAARFSPEVFRRSMRSAIRRAIERHRNGPERSADVRLERGNGVVHA